LEGSGAQRVIGPHAALVAGQDPGVDQDLKVVGDGGLGQPERVGEFADAGLAALVGGRRYLDWELPDPAGLTIEQIRPIRDEISARVRALISELDG
jgi:protein-tyrosine-phosphatase